MTVKSCVKNIKKIVEDGYAIFASSISLSRSLKKEFGFFCFHPFEYLKNRKEIQAYKPPFLGPGF